MTAMAIQHLPQSQNNCKERIRVSACQLIATVESFNPTMVDTAPEAEVTTAEAAEIDTTSKTETTMTEDTREEASDTEAKVEEDTTTTSMTILCWQNSEETTSMTTTTTKATRNRTRSSNEHSSCKVKAGKYRKEREALGVHC